MKAHIAAKRNRGDAPARTLAIIEAEELRAEADREGVDLHPAAARHPEMAKLMEEYDYGENEQEGEYGAQGGPAPDVQTR